MKRNKGLLFSLSGLITIVAITLFSIVLDPSTLDISIYDTYFVIEWKALILAIAIIWLIVGLIGWSITQFWNKRRAKSQ